MTISKNIIIVMLLLAAVFVCYGGSLNAGFVWDDNYLIMDNSLLRAPLLSFQVFKQDIINSNFTHTLYYRPLQVLSYAIDHRLWGMSAFGFHFTNILLHFFNAVLLFFLLKKLTENESIAFLSSLFFAIHPAHTAAVAYISGRSDLLFFLWGILCLLFFARFREKRKIFFLIFSVAFFFLAVLSKEYALIFLFIIPFMDVVLLRKKTGSFCLKDHLPFFLCGVIYLITHYLFLGDKYTLFSVPGNHFVLNITRYLRVIGEFLILCVFPSGLRLRHSLSSEPVFFGLQLTLIFSAITFILLSLRKFGRLLLFSLAAFFASLIPFLFVIDSFGVYAEHWMYFPSVWILLFASVSLIGFFVRSSIKKKILISAFIFIGIVVYTKTCVFQVRSFNNSDQLSDSVLKFDSKDKIALHFKSVDLHSKGDSEGALSQMEKSVEYYPFNPRIWYLKGRMNLSTDQTEPAKLAFEKAIELNDKYANAYVGMALVSLSEKDISAGIANLEKAISLEPWHPEALMLLGMAYYESGDIAKARDIISRSIQVDPYGYDAIVNMGTILTRGGKTQQGGSYYLKAISLYPQRPVPYYNLAYLFFLSEDLKNARTYASQAVFLDPGYKPALDLLQKINAHENTPDNI